MRASCRFFAPSSCFLGRLGVMPPPRAVQRTPRLRRCFVESLAKSLVTVAAALPAFLSLPALHAHAAPNAPKSAMTSAPSAPSTPVSRDALEKLKSADPARIREALDDIRMAGKGGGAPAVAAVVELLRRGLPTALTQAAIETLGDTESESASDTLAWYAHHRSAPIRRAAIDALAKTRGAVAARALRDALSDRDPQVRGAAATGLGALGAKDAMADLFLALDHNVSEAAQSIGQLCVGPECERLADKLGQLRFDVVMSGIDRALFRPVVEVSDDVKVKIVGRVRELGTAEAFKYLSAVQNKWPADWSRRVRQSIDQAVIATSGGSGSGAPGGGEAR